MEKPIKNDENAIFVVLVKVFVAGPVSNNKLLLIYIWVCTWFKFLVQVFKLLLMALNDLDAESGP